VHILARLSATELTKATAARPLISRHVSTVQSSRTGEDMSVNRARVLRVMSLLGGTVLGCVRSHGALMAPHC